MIPLSQEDITAQSQEKHQSKKSKGIETELKCTQPSQHDIDSGYVFGRSFNFLVVMEKVRPPQFETTNQRILDEENAKTVYAKLRSGEINRFAWLTLRPVSYVPPNMSSGVHVSEIMFLEENSKTTFMKTLDAMEGDTFEDKRDAMLPHMTWEPVDGQHVLHACNVLAMADLRKGHLSQEEYDNIFLRRPATVIAYDDAICYGTQSLKLNDYTTTRVHHTTMIQMLNKLRKLWLKLNCPFKINKTMDDQVKFLRNLPSITKVALPADKQTWKQAKEFYKNYLHPTMLDVESWEVFNKMCEAYEKGWTFYGKGSKEEE
jgi:hypothetical protein